MLSLDLLYQSFTWMSVISCLSFTVGRQAPMLEGESSQNIPMANLFYPLFVMFVVALHILWKGNR